MDYYNWLKKKPDQHVLVGLVIQAEKIQQDCIHCQAVVAMDKLKWIQILSKAGIDVHHNQPLKHFITMGMGTTSWQ